MISCPSIIDAVAAKQISVQKASWLNEKKDLALDFRAVERVDNDGFRALSQLAKEAHAQGSKTVSFNPPKKILSAIKKEGLENILNPINTEK